MRTSLQVGEAQRLVLEATPVQRAMLHSTLTDYAGKFRFFDIPQGRYQLTVEKPYQGRAQRLYSLIVDSRPEDLELPISGTARSLSAA